MGYYIPPKLKLSLETPEHSFEPFDLAVEFMRPRGTTLILLEHRCFEKVLCPVAH